jgi:hypothetical protein
MPVSVILPTYNEIRHDLLEKILRNLERAPWLEVIAVDSGSTDGTLAVLRRFPFVKVLEVGPANRAFRLNRGAESASGEILFLHHPRSLPDLKALEWLRDNRNTVSWGGLTHKFDEAHPLLAFTSWYSNFVRGRFGGVVYLDHCLFVHRRLWSGGILPEVDVFEDTLLCRHLRKHSRPRILDYISTTSATRFRKNGMWRQAFLNQVAKAAFNAGVSPGLINEIYERGLNFNGKVPSSKK